MKLNQENVLCLKHTSTNVKKWILTFPNGFLNLGIGMPWSPKSLEQKCNNKQGQNWAPIYHWKRFWNVDIENEFAFSIWNYELNIIAQKNVKNQIVSLFPNHQNLINKGQITFEWSMWYRVEKVYSRNTPFSFGSLSIGTNMLKLWTCKVAWFIIC
jgi:hypothetical protein